MMKNIRAILLLIAVLLIFSRLNFAQTSAAPPLAAQKAAMQKVDFLLGTWHGSGWIMFGPNKRENFSIDERVQIKLDGLVIVIEGVGTSDGKIVHNALGLLSYDAEKQKYVWEAFTKMGNRIETTPEISVGKFVWGFSNSQMGGTVRYTISLDEKGDWLEIGEFSRDNGQTWSKNFEMHLQKAK